MDIQKLRWSHRLDFAMLSAWLLTGLILGIIAVVWFGKDFRGYYAAAHVLVGGGNPYDYNQVAPILLLVTGEMGNNPYYYPPWFAWMFIPLTFLPFAWARVIWMTFNFMIWNLALWRLGMLVGWPKKGWRRYLLFTMATCGFAWITWKYEQAGFLVFAILVALMLAVQEQKSTWVGIWLALLLVKPNVTLIVIAGIGLWLLRRGEVRALLVMAFTLLMLLSISTWITPDWFQPFLADEFGQGLTSVLDGPERVVALRIHTTLPYWLETIGVESPLNVVVYGICIVVGVLVFVWVVCRSKSLLEMVSILLLISFALTPYALQYDYPPLAIVLLWALAQCASSPKALQVGLPLTGFVCSVIFWQQNITWGFWIVVGLIALTVWVLYQRADRHPEQDAPIISVTSVKS